MNEEIESHGSGALWRLVSTCRQMTARDRRNSRKATG